MINAIYILPAYIERKKINTDITHPIFPWSFSYILQQLLVTVFYYFSLVTQISLLFFGVPLKELYSNIVVKNTIPQRKRTCQDYYLKAHFPSVLACSSPSSPKINSYYIHRSYIFSYVACTTTKTAAKYGSLDHFYMRNGPCDVLQVHLSSNRNS